MIKKVVIIFIMVFCALAHAGQNTVKPRNVIFIVADGFGPASVTLGRYFKEDALNLDKWMKGSVRTYSASSLITDSAAGATAYAAGVKTYNRAISVDSSGKPVRTLMEAAKEAGMATGLVVTSHITDATPACFVAHAKDRGEHDSIAKQMMALKPDVILGGGRGYFIPQSEGGYRNDSQNLVRQAKEAGYHYAETKVEMNAIHQLPIMGLFAMSAEDYEIDRNELLQPSLSEQTEKALELLQDAPNGFFMLLEASLIDHGGHDNDVAVEAHEILAYDKTIAVVQNFLKTHPDTLVVATADHETGGLTIGSDVNRKVKYKWSREPIVKVKASKMKIVEKLGQQASLNSVYQLLGFDDLSDNEKMTFEKLYADKDYKALADKLFIGLDERTRTGWTTGGHTAVDVNLYAAGMASEAFKGNMNNIDVANTIADIMNFKIGRQS